MQKLNPKKPEDNPLMAAILASVMIKHSKRTGDKAQEKAALELLQIARDNQDKMPTLDPSSKLAKAIRQLKMAAEVQPVAMDQDSEKAGLLEKVRSKAGRFARPSALV